MKVSSDLTRVPSSPFHSILNFRDIGTTICTLLPSSLPLLKSSLLYRSAHLDSASSNDRQALVTAYGIRTILDLRSDTERLAQEKRRNSSVELTSVGSLKIPGVKYAYINLNGGAFARALLWKLSWGSMAKLLGYMAAGYRIEAISILGAEVMAPRGLVGLGRDSLEHCKAEVLQVFAALAEEDNYPILIHCTQGKDRTGLVVLLLLLLLEVPMEAIAADYVASERELESNRQERMREIRSIGLGEEFADCPTGFVEELETHIYERFGGVQRYLEGCGVDMEMRERINRHVLAR